MKKLSLITLLTLMMSVVSLQGNAQEDNNKETVVIRMIEYSTSKNGGIVITNPEGISNEIELEKLNPRDKVTTYGKNAQILQNEINKWKKKGFNIEGISISDYQASIIVTIVILSKE